MTPPRDDEPPRDAWLREALRHAPDADAAPPAELSAAILRQARDAAKAAVRTPATSHPLLQLWSWLARPPVAAGFASVMIATLVGVMWWDHPLDASLPRSEPPTATVAQSPAPAPISTPLAAAAPPRAPEQEEARTTTRAAKEAAPALTARRADARERASTDRARAAADGESRTRSAAPAVAPPPPAASPAPAGEIPAKAGLADARDEAAAPRGASAQGFAKSAPAPVAALAQRRQEAATVTPAIDQPERWTWQRGGAELTMTPALQRWLAKLDRTVRWRPAEAAHPPADATVLRLWRDGAPYATLQLGSEAVWLTPTGGAPVTAPLSPATAAALQAALIAATP